MPEHLVIGGAAAYQDREGQERWAYSGQTIDFTDAEADRLMAAGMLHDEDAAQARADAAAQAVEDARAQEDQRRLDEAERLAGERAAAAQAAGTSGGGDGDTKPWEKYSVAQITDALATAQVDKGTATTRRDLWALLPEDARAALSE